MEFTDLEELKEFISWCRDNGIVIFEQNGLKFQISESVTITKSIKVEPNNNIISNEGSTLLDEENLTDDELLFYSADQ